MKRKKYFLIVTLSLLVAVTSVILFQTLYLETGSRVLTDEPLNDDAQFSYELFTS